MRMCWSHLVKNMGKRVFGFVLLAALISGVLAADLATVLKMVPDEERVDFLRYHAERGYQLETSGTTKDYQMGLPDEFSMEVYRSLLPKSMDNNVIINALSCIVCWPNGKCVDLCDPGVHPV